MKKKNKVLSKKPVTKKRLPKKAKAPIKKLLKKKKPKVEANLVTSVEIRPEAAEPVKVIVDLSKEVDDKKKKAPATVENGRIYWTKDTEAAIGEYKKTVEQPIRDRIYNERIRHSFEKLAENVFNTFKFTYIDVSPVETQKDCIAHLIMGIDKFNADLGAGRSFGYFSIIAKHFYILLNNSNYNNWKRQDHIDTSSESNHELVIDDRIAKQHSENREFLDLMVKFWDNHINNVFKKKRDIVIAEAIITLFRNSDRMETFNKKALYLYIRDIARCKTQHITKVINKMKTIQDSIRNDYLTNGCISDNRIKAFKHQV
jgi:hypothetical protein